MEYNNIFTGKFAVGGIYGNVLNKGWTLFKEYEPGTFTWEFSHVCVRHYSNSCGYEGCLKEYYKGCVHGVTTFCYYPADRELYIDRSHDEAKGAKKVYIGNNFRVQPIDDDAYWLYVLEDVEKEPDDYQFRLKIKKIQ